MLALSHQEWHSGRFAGFDTGPWLLGSSAANTGNGGVKNKIYIESMMSATYTTQLHEATTNSTKYQHINRSRIHHPSCSFSSAPSPPTDGTPHTLISIFGTWP